MRFNTDFLIPTATSETPFLVLLIVAGIAVLITMVAMLFGNIPLSAVGVVIAVACPAFAFFAVDKEISDRESRVSNIVSEIEEEYGIETLTQNLRITLGALSLNDVDKETGITVKGFAYRHDGDIYITDLLVSGNPAEGGVSVSLFNIGSSAERLSPFEAGHGDVQDEEISVLSYEGDG